MIGNDLYKVSRNNIISGNALKGCTTYFMYSFQKYISLYIKTWGKENSVSDKNAVELLFCAALNQYGATLSCPLCAPD